MIDEEINHNGFNTLAKWLETSASAFDVVVGDKSRFPDTAIFVDQAFLGTAYERAFTHRFGVFELDDADLALQKIALRFLRPVAHAQAPNLDVTASGLTHAWFHSIWSELATLSATRYLARSLVKSHKGSVFVIDIPDPQFSAIKYWRENEFEPLVLAFELRRHGAKVCIRLDRLDKPAFRFSLSSHWRRKWRSQFDRDDAFSEVICKKHIRRDEFIAETWKGRRALRPGLFDLIGAWRAERAGEFTLPLHQGPNIEGLRVFSAPEDTPSLRDGFIALMSPATIFFRDWWRRKLRNTQIKIAHVADHSSLEGGLLAAEVLKQGGDVHIWPHSAGVVDVNVHEPGNIQKLTLAVRSTAEIWADRFGADKVSVDARTILPNLPPGPAFIETRPLHVILFGGGHTLQRLPFFSLDQHKASWARVLSDIQAAGFDLTVKHKSQWETREWIRQRAENPDELQFSRTPPIAMTFPNMVFMSISLTSTALFEGIARGIPAVVVRDVALRETPHYDPDFVPRIRSDAVAELLQSLNSKSAWEDLRDRQLEWFARETSSPR